MPRSRCRALAPRILNDLDVHGRQSKSSNSNANPRDQQNVEQVLSHNSHAEKAFRRQPHYESLPPPLSNYPAAFDDTAGASHSVHQPHPEVPYNNYTMSLAYENRGFADYPTGTMMEEPSHDHSLHQQHLQPRYPSPPPMVENHYSAQLDPLEIQMSELPHKEEEDVGSPGRSKPLIKPDRQVTKGEDGKFVCSWNGCTEETRSFNRKCEWSKHMDKHDRPYKCPADGCEKLPGFTYSGGLLRHQREVHGLHGGPRKQLNCPHLNCKRHSGKGFSRQENLNEHLRRVHTTAEGEIANLEETEEEGSERAGMKRKRIDHEGRDDGNDMRANYARLAQENADLRRQVDLQGSQINELMHQIQEFQQNILNPRMPNQAPQALM